MNLNTESAKVLLRGYSALEKMLTQGQNTEEGIKKGAYPFIPFNQNTFIAMLMRVKKHAKPKDLPFYDFGCGFGSKLILAHLLGYKRCIGVEYNKEMVWKGSSGIAEFFNYSIGQRGDYPIEIYIGDLNDLDARLTHEYRMKSEPMIPKHPIVAYYYCPMFNEPMQKQFEKNLENKLAVGSYIIGCLKKDYTIHKDKRFTRISDKAFDPIWKKISN